MFKKGRYYLHAISHQLIYRSPEATKENPNYIIPEFIEAQWDIETEKEYLEMLDHVEKAVYSRWYARKGAANIKFSNSVDTDNEIF